MKKDDSEKKDSQEKLSLDAALDATRLIFGAKDQQTKPSMGAFFQAIAARADAKEPLGQVVVVLMSPDSLVLIGVAKDSSDHQRLIEAGWFVCDHKYAAASMKMRWPKNLWLHLKNIKPVPGVSESRNERILEEYRHFQTRLEKTEKKLTANYPPIIQRLWADYPWDKLYRIKQTGQIVVIDCYWDDGSIGVKKHDPESGQESNVFDVAPADLEAAGFH